MGGRGGAFFWRNSDSRPSFNHLMQGSWNNGGCALLTHCRSKFDVCIICICLFWQWIPCSNKQIFLNNPRSILKRHGILHNTTIHHDDAIMALDFHVFDIQDFGILIGHLLEKLFIGASKTRDLSIKLGRDTFSIPITRAKNSVAKSLPILTYPRKLCRFYPSILPSRL